MAAIFSSSARVWSSRPRRLGIRPGRSAPVPPPERAQARAGGSGSRGGRRAGPAPTGAGCPQRPGNPDDLVAPARGNRYSTARDRSPRSADRAPLAPHSGAAAFCLSTGPTPTHSPPPFGRRSGVRWRHAMSSAVEGTSVPTAPRRPEQVERGRRVPTRRPEGVAKQGPRTGIHRTARRPARDSVTAGQDRTSEQEEAAAEPGPHRSG